MNGKIISTLVGGLLALGLLWVTFAPTAVTRAEMQDYVEVTATEHLRILRGDFKDVKDKLVEVGERLAGVEAIIRERQ